MGGLVTSERPIMESEAWALSPIIAARPLQGEVDEIWVQTLGQGFNQSCLGQETPVETVHLKPGHTPPRSMW